MFHTASSWFLLLLLLVPALGWLLFRSRTTAIAFSSTENLRKLPTTWKQRLRWLPPAMLLAAIMLMIVALARPQEGRKQTISESEGIAIELLVDRSGSMQAMDFKIEGEHVDRLTAIKNVAGQFVNGGDKLDGRTSDLVGLITFAGQADGVTPPTLDHAFLVGQLNQSEIVTQQSEDGTAIGDAIGLAVEKLTSLENSETRNIKSKVAILLTDGENNAGDVDPIQAAELAATLGVKIYTIGVGTNGQAPVPVVDPFTGRKVVRWMEVKIDEQTLTKVAEVTGGKYFRATDTESLQNIYQEIDKLEKSRLEEKQYVDYREWAIEPVHVAGFALPPLALLALLLLVARELLINTTFRQLG
ncbi:vWA domain-containing protein [Adhaeretor mobilis]|uniref:von Willebrand factor type A domain protein n=1 Tax=Adhaeretor mobilis TaxID=1930276 RepID=A0A517MPV7_9BACT|nr:VWA domain-containing protein [Adhaeretor mobilis]QDS96902.1 von Willebrand factor type A domain protein [Adhaeretor mobilis]